MLSYHIVKSVNFLSSVFSGWHTQIHTELCHFLHVCSVVVKSLTLTLSTFPAGEEGEEGEQGL